MDPIQQDSHTASEGVQAHATSAGAEEALHAGHGGSYSIDAAGTVRVEHQTEQRAYSRKAPLTDQDGKVVAENAFAASGA